MSWDQCTFPVRARIPKTYEAFSIFIAANRPNRRALSLPIGLLRPGWEWCARITAADGAGEHAGLLRLALALDGEIMLVSMGRSTAAKSPKLLSALIPLPAGVEPFEGRPRSYVQHRWEGDALILGPLPDWARPHSGPLPPRERSPRRSPQGEGRAGEGAPPIPDYLTGPPPQAGGTFNVTNKLIPRR